MFKNFVRSSAIVLALTFLAVPVQFAHAQAPLVTGTDPVPTGEPQMMMFIAFGQLSSL